jgi:hypothetical protein
MWSTVNKSRVWSLYIACFLSGRAKDLPAPPPIFMLESNFFLVFHGNLIHEELWFCLRQSIIKPFCIPAGSPQSLNLWMSYTCTTRSRATAEIKTAAFHLKLNISWGNQKINVGNEICDRFWSDKPIQVVTVLLLTVIWTNKCTQLLH